MNSITLYYGVRLYSNRIVQEDLSKATKTQTFSNINFIQGNGIDTVLTVGKSGTGWEVDTTNSPSYLIVDEGTDNATCWFVITATKQNSVQLTLTLKRDFLSEKWDLLKTSPFLCTKAATIPSALSEAKYKKTTNLSQVKKAEYLIKDRPAGNGYLVLYLAKAQIDETTGKNTSNIGEFSPSVTDNETTADITISTPIEEFALYGTNGTKHILTYESEGISTTIRVQTSVTDSKYYTATLYSYNDYDLENRGTTTAFLKVIDSWSDDWFSDIQKGFNSAIEALANLAIYSPDSSNTYEHLDIEDIYFYNGKTIKDSENNIYQINITDDSTSPYVQKNGGSIAMALSGAGTSERPATTAIDAFNESAGTTSSDTITGSFIPRYYTISISLVDPAKTIMLQYGYQSYVTTNDANYDIAILPLGGTFSLNGEIYTINDDDMFKFAAAVQEKMTGSVVYDIQWLPFIPFDITQDITQDLELDTSAGGVSATVKAMPIIESESSVDSPVGLLVYLSKAQGTLSLNSNLTIKVLNENLAQAVIPGVENLDIPYQPIEQRIYNEEKMFRFVSPNYASQFEFSPVKNQGLSSYLIDIALKPYSPYIYISPVYKNLYGGNFMDGRGLILAGDFSMDQVTNAWQTYKLQNKNYELIFNRQVQSMELQNEYANKLGTQSIVQSVLNAGAGTAGGAIAGFMAGGAGGAVAGGVASGIAGIADIAVNASNVRTERAIRDDKLQATKDIWQYQLGNIQALPNTLTKVSAFNPDFKIYPLIEYYSCTDEEDTTLRNAIKYNGIEINLMTTLNQFSSGYIQGSIAQFPSSLNINEEQARAINAELQFGVYYKEV